MRLQDAAEMKITDTNIKDLLYCAGVNCSSTAASSVPVSNHTSTSTHNRSLSKHRPLKHAYRQKNRTNNTGIWKKTLQKDYANELVSEGNKRGNLHRSVVKTKSTASSNTEKTATFLTYHKMNGSWKIKLLAVGIMDRCKAVHCWCSCISGDWKPPLEQSATRRHLSSNAVFWNRLKTYLFSRSCPS